MIYRIILLLDFSEQYSRDIFKGIKTFAKDNGDWLFCFMPVYQQTTKGIEGILQWAEEWGANGIIGQFYNHTDISRLTSSGIPVIAQDFKERFDGLTNITGSYHETGFMGAQYFIRKGFRNFGFYGFENIVWSRERAQGFGDALRLSGFSFYAHEFQEYPNKELWQYKPSQLIKWLERLPKPIAIMACDDNRAQYICEVCRLLGLRIPEEVAILGVDNDESICDFSNPALSSIKLNVEKGGYDAAMTMKKMIDNNMFHSENIHVSPLNIITRQSSNTYATQDPHVSDLLKFIHSNIGTKINVQILLQKIPVSRRKLEKKFFSETQSSIYQYILNLKMEKFGEMLLQSSDPISVISEEMGFADDKNIARTFKKIYGCTPKEYRQRNIYLNYTLALQEY